MSVNIEHINVNQETEYIIESILTKARESNLFKGDTFTLEKDSGVILSGGDVVSYLDEVILIARQLSKIYSKRDKYVVDRDIRDLIKFQDRQVEFKKSEGSFEVFPTQPDSFLVAEYKKTFNE